MIYDTPFFGLLTITASPRGAKYSKFLLSCYDFVVWEINSPICWGIEAETIRSLYASNAGNTHADIGPGTGFFLPGSPRVRDLTVLDFNSEALTMVKDRILPSNQLTALHRFMVDMMEPDPFVDPSIAGPPFTWIEVNKFDSVAANFVVHCIKTRGSGEGGVNSGIAGGKEVFFTNVAKLLKPGGCFFGSTIVNEPGGGFNKRGAEVMGRFNGSGIFHNVDDTQADLREVLERHFDDV
ncbi:hypothetical protein TrRE_jg2674, partial [Triparma retinervis]